MNRRGPVLATGVEQLGLRSVRRVADTYARRRTAGAGGRATGRTRAVSDGFRSPGQRGLISANSKAMRVTFRTIVRCANCKRQDNAPRSEAKPKPNLTHCRVPGFQANHSTTPRRSPRCAPAGKETLHKGTVPGVGCGRGRGGNGGWRRGIGVDGAGVHADVDRGGGLLAHRRHLPRRREVPASPRQGNRDWCFPAFLKSQHLKEDLTLHLGVHCESRRLRERIRRRSSRLYSRSKKVLICSFSAI